MARGFLHRWEQLEPDDDGAVRDRICLELVSGAYGLALELIDRAPAANPDDKQAKAQPANALRTIKELSNDALEAKP